MVIDGEFRFVKIVVITVAMKRKAVLRVGKARKESVGVDVAVSFN